MVELGTVQSLSLLWVGELDCKIANEFNLVPSQDEDLNYNGSDFLFIYYV